MGWSVCEDLLCLAEDGTIYFYTLNGDLKRMITTGQVLQIIFLFSYGDLTLSCMICSFNFSSESFIIKIAYIYACYRVSCS